MLTDAGETWLRCHPAGEQQVIAPHTGKLLIFANQSRRPLVILYLPGELLVISCLSGDPLVIPYLAGKS